MAVSTIYQTKRTSSHSALLIYGLIIIAIIALAYFGFDFIKNLGNLGGKATLTADVEFGNAEIYLDDELLGPTPLAAKEVKASEHKINFKSQDVEYEVTLDFMPNAEVVIKRDLGVSQAFSSGQNFWIEKSDSNVLSIISEPSGADVFIDGTRVGKTPYSTSDLTEGDYDLRIEAPGYEAQAARIEINKGYKLNVSATLFPIPVPEKVELLPDSQNLYDVYSDNLTISSDSLTWVESIIYWNSTRGVNLSGVGVNKEKVFDFYIDYNGKLYDSEGNTIDPAASGDALKDATKGAYLRKLSDGPGLSEPARTTFLSLGTLAGGKTATILDTGLGFLRVRDQPSFNGVELTRVDVGASFPVLEETTGWVKIRVSDEVEGWVSDTYVEIEE